MKKIPPVGVSPGGGGENLCYLEKDSLKGTMKMKSNRKIYGNISSNASSKDLVGKRDNGTQENSLLFFLFNLITYLDDTSTCTSNPRGWVALQELAIKIIIK